MKKYRKKLAIINDSKNNPKIFNVIQIYIALSNFYNLYYEAKDIFFLLLLNKLFILKVVKISKYLYVFFIKNKKYIDSYKENNFLSFIDT